MVAGCGTVFRGGREERQGLIGEDPIIAVKELTHGMGGSVDVESTPGEGTRFTVRMPRAAADVFTDGLPAPNREQTQRGNDATVKSEAQR